MTQKHTVNLYSTPTCHFCKATKAFFKDNHVKFTEHSVIENKDDARKMIQETGQQGVPVIVIDGDWDTAIIGFDEPELRKRLDIKKTK